jgi:hypothetical protein
MKRKSKFSWEPRRAWMLIGSADSGAPQQLSSVLLTCTARDHYELTVALWDGKRQTARFTAGSDKWAQERALEAIEARLALIADGKPFDFIELERLF